MYGIKNRFLHAQFSPSVPMKSLKKITSNIAVLVHILQ